jgi:hypothetical protein
LRSAREPIHPNQDFRFGRPDSQHATPQHVACDEYLSRSVAHHETRSRSSPRRGINAGRLDSLGMFRKLVKKLGPAAQLRVCYEAGPTGYVVYWQLQYMTWRPVPELPEL